MCQPGHCPQAWLKLHFEEASMPYGIQSFLNQIQFGLRENFLGRVKLRKGVPYSSAANARDTAELEFYRLLLRTALPNDTRKQVDEAWDIGCRNWSYARAVGDSFPNARLVGVEVDGKRRYWNLYRRQDAAEASASKLREQGRAAQLHFQDFRRVSLKESKAQAPAFCFFYPFVSERPCVKWGLPKEFADFGALLKHAGSHPSAFKIITSFHQGEWEGELAMRFYQTAGLSFRQGILQPSQFEALWPSRYPVYYLVSGAKRDA